MDHQLHAHVPASLVHQIQLWITMHLEQLPVSQLSLLPLTTRKELLLKLPIADICQLEDKKFVEGIDMREFWGDAKMDFYSFWPAHFSPSHYSWGLGSPQPSLMEIYSSDTELCRSLLYGGVAQVVLRPDLINLNVLSFLYCVRKSDGCCQLVFPPRYVQQNKFDSTEDVIEAVVSCFRGKLPRILELYMDGTDYEASPKYAHFVREVEYLRVWVLDGAKGFDFLNLFLDKAANLRS